MIKIPPYLKSGDTIGIVCPAGFMAAEKVQTCIDTLQQWGYKVKTGTTVGGSSTTYFSGTDEERLFDFQQMLDDDEVNAVLCGRGGYGMGRIIDSINFKKFSKKPKWIIGYSDITVLHSHLYRNYHISSIHAPMAAAFNDDGSNISAIAIASKREKNAIVNTSSWLHKDNRVFVTTRINSKGKIFGGLSEYRINDAGMFVHWSR